MMRLGQSTFRLFGCILFVPFWLLSNYRFNDIFLFIALCQLGIYHITADVVFDVMRIGPLTLKPTN